MGEINLMAPKEYKSVKRRFDLMNQQKEDLLRAERDLRKIIKEIDKVSKELFLKTFEEIRSNFQKIFEELFEGGKVDLVMTTEDPLTAGVEIVVEPPGKRLQNISLLSGGERALTAIALLFGMFMTKPSPFCVLDEIDAALDDANIIRYTRLLKKFSKGSQFLIITHNKKTMEVSDVLYGITMEKPGISKLISVRWKEGAVS
jgi:chromosome segregation protein